VPCSTVKQDLLKLNRSVNSVLAKNAVAKNQAKNDTIKAKDGTNKIVHLANKLLTLSQQKDPLSES
jgi:protein tyrosine/serine phosphatase